MMKKEGEDHYASPKDPLYHTPATVLDEGRELIPKWVNAVLPQNTAYPWSVNNFPMA